MITLPGLRVQAKQNLFHPSELFMLIITLCAALVNLVLILVKGATIDWMGYSGLFVLSLTLIGAGIGYRLSRRSERIALTMIGAGSFIIFSAMVSMYNYLLLPIVRPVIDIPLAEVDAMFGYHWPDIMALAADNLMISNILKIAYMTTMPQIALLVVILGLTGRQMELHRLLVAVTITATFSICFWGLFPTLGAKSMYELPAELWMTINPIVDQVYTADLKNIAINGPQVITPSEIRGLIAFPSYHAVLAFTAIYAARTVKWAFPLFIVMNVLILPGIFVHGGHHLVDLPAGFVVFVLGYFASNYAVGRVYKNRALDETCPA